jgi:hypothetical protein
MIFVTTADLISLFLRKYSHRNGGLVLPKDYIRTRNMYGKTQQGMKKPSNAIIELTAPAMVTPNNNKLKYDTTLIQETHWQKPLFSKSHMKLIKI